MEIPFRAALLDWLAADPVLTDTLNAIAEEVPSRTALPWLALSASASTNWSTKDLAGREVRVAFELHTRGNTALSDAALVAAIERRIESLPADQSRSGFRVASLVFSRARAEQRGEAERATLLEYRARLLADAVVPPEAPAPTPAFDPLSVGPSVFYTNAFDGLFQDREGTAPVTAYGQPVAIRLDRSGHGHHQVAPADGQRPLIQQDSAGRNYLAFDGVDDWVGSVFPVAALGMSMRVMAALQRGGGSVPIGDLYNSANFLACAQSGNLSPPDAYSGDPSYRIDGVALAAGSAATQADLAAAWTAGANHTVEAIAADLSGWAGFGTGNHAALAGLTRCYGQIAVPEANLDATTAPQLRTFIAGLAGLTP